MYFIWLNLFFSEWLALRLNFFWSLVHVVLNHVIFYWVMWFWPCDWASTSDWISDDVISIFGMEKWFFFSVNLSGTRDWRRRLCDRKHEGFIIPLKRNTIKISSELQCREFGTYRSLWQFRCFLRRFGFDSIFLGHAIET